MALCASASSASWPIVGANRYYRFANSCYECPHLAARMRPSPKQVLQQCGSVHVAVARCFCSRVSLLWISTRNQWNGGFVLTALNFLPVPAKSTNASHAHYTCVLIACPAAISLVWLTYLPLSRWIRCLKHFPN